MEAYRLLRPDHEPPAGQQARALRGYVWWRASDDGRLRSIGDGTGWEPGTNVARCALYPRFMRGRWNRIHPLGVPGAFCFCGFHASNRPVPANAFSRMGPRLGSGHDGLLFGVIEGWGMVFTRHDGWRARYARPLAAYVGPQSAESAMVPAPGDAGLERLSSRYGIPVLRDFDELVGTFGPSIASDGLAVARRLGLALGPRPASMVGADDMRTY